jgi:hypothetical protein
MSIIEGEFDRSTAGAAQALDFLTCFRAEGVTPRMMNITIQAIPRLPPRQPREQGDLQHVARRPDENWRNSPSTCTCSTSCSRLRMGG